MIQLQSPDAVATLRARPSLQLLAQSCAGPCLQRPAPCRMTSSSLSQRWAFTLNACSFCSFCRLAYSLGERRTMQLGSAWDVLGTLGCQGGGPLRSFPLSWKHRHRAPESLETHRLAGKAPSRSGFVRSTAPRYELIIQSGVIQEQLRSSCKMNSLLVKQCQARQRRL